MPEHRELRIDFGDSGYVALYRYADSQVTVLALRHQREAGYRAQAPSLSDDWHWIMIASSSGRLVVLKRVSIGLSG